MSDLHLGLQGGDFRLHLGDLALDGVRRAPLDAAAPGRRWRLLAGFRHRDGRRGRQGRLVIGIIAGVRRAGAVVQKQQPVDDTVQEITVVRHDQQGARVVRQGLLKDLAGGDVQVVGRLVEHQQVGLGQHQLGERHAALLAAAEAADSLQHLVAREQKAAQMASHLALRPIRRHLPHLVEHGVARPQAGQFLVVIRHGDVAASAQDAVVGRFLAHQQAQQGALAGTIGPRQADLLAAVDGERQAPQHLAVAVALLQVAAHQHLVVFAPVGGEPHVHAATVAARLVQALHARQHLLAALRLPGVLPGDVAADKFLVTPDLGLLLVVGLCLLLAAQRLGRHVGGIIAGVALQAVLLQLDDLIDGAVEKIAIVRHHDDGARVVPQDALQPFRRLHVEVVRGLVEQQQIGLLQKHAGQGGDVLLAAAEVPNRRLQRLAAKPQSGERGLNAGVDGIALPSAERLHQRPIALHVGVAGLLLRHARFQAAHFRLHVQQGAERLAHLVVQRPVALGRHFLGEVAEAHLAR